MGRIDQDEVDVAIETPVLESVVEHEEIGVVVGHRPRRRTDAIGVLKVYDLGQPFGEQQRLVVDTGVGAVAAAQDRRSATARLEPPTNPFHHRGLAGAAGRDVADADHRGGRAVDRRDAPVVQGVAYRDDKPVQTRRHPQERAHEERREPAALTAHDRPPALQRAAPPSRLPSAGKLAEARRAVNGEGGGGNGRGWG